MNLTNVVTVRRNNSTKKASCQKCKYYERAFVPSYIYSSDIAIIGEAPGKFEASEEIPFIGESGQLLRKILREVGIDSEKISYLNTVKCHPPENETPDKETRIFCSKSFLKEELQQLNLKLIILSGSVALNIFFQDKITDVRGTFLSLENKTFLPILHPAYCLRNPDSISLLRADLNKAVKFINGTLSSDRKYTIVSNLEELKKTEELLSKQKIFAVDIETNTLDPFDKGARIDTIAFSYDIKKGICIPLNHPENVNIEFKEKAFEAIQRIMSNDSKKVFQNATFDIKFLKKFGIRTKNFYADTLVMAFLLDENRVSHGLKQLASEFLDGCIYSFTSGLNQLALYNCEDSDNTLQLFYIFFKELKKHPKMLDLFNVVLMPMIECIVDMELIGIQIDIEYAKELTKKYTRKIEVISEQIVEEFPQAIGINLASPQQLGKLLFEVLKYPPGRKTETGKWSVDGEVLENLVRGGYKIAKYLLMDHKYRKLLGTYVEKMPSIVKNDGRLRGSFLICKGEAGGARTGRLSSRNPNLQNIPRDKDIKKMFIAKEGSVLINIDASQAELRVGCSIAGDTRMINAYNKGIDIHKLTASTMLNKEMEKITKEDRQNAKAVNFGLIYGQSAEGLQKTALYDYNLVLSIEQCNKFRKRFFEIYTGFVIWHNNVKEELRKYGYVEYPTGRRRRFPQAKGLRDIPGEIFRAAVNAPVQGSSSDLVVFTMVRLYQFLHQFPAKIISTVHDSIILECKYGYEKEVIEKVNEIAKKEIPKQFSWFRVPMVFDASIGLTWGDMKEIKNS